MNGSTVAAESVKTRRNLCDETTTAPATTAAVMKVIHYTAPPWQAVLRDIGAHIQRVCMEHEAFSGKPATFTETTFPQMRDMFGETSPYRPEVIQKAISELASTHLLEVIGVNQKSGVNMFRRTNNHHTTSNADADSVFTRKMRVHDIEQFILAYVCDNHHFDAEMLQRLMDEKLIYSVEEITSVLEELSMQPDGIIERYNGTWFIMRSDMD